MGLVTTSIISSTAFLLGTTFTHWISDHNTLWRSPVTSSAYLTSLSYYNAFVSSPPIVFYTWCTVFAIAVASISWRVVRGFMAEGRGQGEFLFDGASLFLFGSFAWIHLTQISPTYNLIPRELPSLLDASFLESQPSLKAALIDLAASHVLSAVALTGVLALQGARYYSTHLDTSDEIDESLRSPASPAFPPVSSPLSTSTSSTPNSPPSLTLEVPPLNLGPVLRSAPAAASFSPTSSISLHSDGTGASAGFEIGSGGGGPITGLPTASLRRKANRSSPGGKSGTPRRRVPSDV